MASAGANRDIAKSRLDMGSGSGDAALKVHGWMSWTLAPRVTSQRWLLGVWVCRKREVGGCGGFAVAVFWPGDGRNGRPPSSTRKIAGKVLVKMRLAADEI